MTKTYKEDDIVENLNLNILLEPSYVLLQTLRKKCPGSFKHSQYLSSIVESVCTALNRDPLMLRVASMYHDVGKILKPDYFAEDLIAAADLIQPFERD